MRNRTGTSAINRRKFVAKAKTTSTTPSTPSTPPTTDTGLVGAANCGAGTVWKEDPGFCVATPEALLHLCKIARGEQWAWTCEHLCSVK